jgi:farnesyl-diphosphate farnesyltransferase
MYPTQDPKKIAAAKQPRQEEPGMDTWEAFLLMFSVIAVLFAVGGLMVRHFPSLPYPDQIVPTWRPICAVDCANNFILSQIGSAWLLGAKFDQLFKSYDDKMKAGKTVVTAATTAITTIRDEL